MSTLRGSSQQASIAGTGTFGGPILLAVGVAPERAIAADLDGDGHADLVAVNRDSNTISVLVNQTCPPEVVGDANGDGLVNVDDLLEVINAWGACADKCAADFDGNGVVNVDDLLIVINNWS